MSNNNTPDFDKMSPEELMAWMESLARRQGADEGFTTDKVIDVPEIDPNTVQDTGPGYIPYGMDAATWEKKQADERAKKAARQTTAAIPTPAPAPTPTPAPTPVPAAASAAIDPENMTPEQLMAWMESLARRQGADEGFTSNVIMDVPEVDPNTVQDTGPGYIPYGMDAATWEKKQADERAKKAARQQSQTPPAATPAPTLKPAPSQAMPPITPPPTPTPAPAAASAAIDPENMTPEQLMAWMESLARRQGADEGFTSNVVMDLPDIDPATVQDTGPGYIPYGMDAATWEKKQADERAKKAARQQSQTPPTAAPTPPPLERLPEFSEDFTTQALPASDNPLAWLDSLAQDSGSSTMPDFGQLDLSGLGEPVTAPTASNDDPLAWLESLSNSNNLSGLEQFSLSDLDALTVPPTPTPTPVETGADPLAWLESLAKRQGADEEELFTPANVEIPLPENPPLNQGYTEYAVEPVADNTLDFLELGDDFVAEFDTDNVDPQAQWLDALARGEDLPVEAGEATPKTDQIMDALSKNQVNPSAIENWMASLLEKGAQRTDVNDYLDDDEEEVAAQAQLPDWLIEQVGPPPATITQTTERPAALTNAMPEPPEVELPDWLRDDVEPTEAVDFDAIFDDVVETPATKTKLSTSEIEIDTSDPWVEAFELERKQGGVGDIDRLPEWYVSKLGAQAPLPNAPQLQAAAFPPETELQVGELQPLPAWLGGSTTPPIVIAQPEEAIAVSDMPDWLREQITEDAAPTEELPDWLRQAGVNATEVPEWLKDTLDTSETEAVPAVVIAPTPVTPAPTPVVTTPVPAPTPPPVVSPAPVPTVAAAINVSAALNEARQSFKTDLTGSLQQYEAVVRANSSLDEVIGDLSNALKDEVMKKNPALYRVLGDALMRRGKLQEALDTYRKALNLL